MFISGEYIKGKKNNSFILFFDIIYSIVDNCIHHTIYYTHSMKVLIYIKLVLLKARKGYCNNLTKRMNYNYQNNYWTTINKC